MHYNDKTYLSLQKSCMDKIYFRCILVFSLPQVVLIIKDKKALLLYIIHMILSHHIDRSICASFVACSTPTVYIDATTSLQHT